jgi:trk system potassium uptake protein TrkH
VEWRKTRKLRLHSKIAIIMTSFLVIGGTLFFMLAEWSNTGSQALGTLPVWQRPIAAFFQSVTLRTAGFNSINQSNLFAESKLISVILMFIGAGSGSTGGGIKISTFAVLMYTIISDIHGKGVVTMKNYRIPSSLVRRAITIFFLGLAIMLGLSLALSFAEHEALRAGQFGYLDLLFEAASAFGTVGVTSANTPILTQLSQWLIIPAMFLGRVGPATFAISLAMQDEKEQANVYPDAKVQIG